MAEETTGIVLAGGRSIRLGRDKAGALVAGKSLLEWAVLPLLSLCSRVLVVTSPGHSILVTLAFPGVETVADVEPGRGPLGGLYTGLLASDTPYSLVVGCDMPFLSPEVLKLVLDLAPGWQAAVPRVQGIPQPLHAAYSRECLPAIEELLESGGPGLMDLLSIVRVRYVEEEELVPTDPRLLSFLNVNTEADLSWARELLEREGRA